MLGRFMIGLSVGCYLFVVQIYVGEISSTSNRGSLLNFIHIFIHLGAIFVYTLGYLISHNSLNIILSLIPMLYALGFQLMVESPPFLMRNEKFKEAEAALYCLRDNKKLFENELILLRNNSCDTVSNKTFNELLRIKSTRRAMIIMCTQFFFFQMSGFNAIKFYAQTIFEEAGMSNLHPGVAAIIYASVLTLSACLATIIARHFDRRVMLCFFNFFCACSLIVIGGYFHMQKKALDISGFKWIPLFAVCVYSIAFSLGTASVTWSLLGELFTIEAKKTIASFAQVINHGLTFIIVLTFTTLVERFGIENIFYVFGLATFADIIFAYFIIPETRGRSIDEIQNQLRN